MDKRKLINSLIKPWEELNDLLSRPLAMQPDESDFVTKAESLSVFISHFPEQCGLTRNQIDSRSKPNALITDIADSSKHKELSKQDRNSDMKVTADYEFRVNAEGHNEYRFIRNCINVEHRQAGEFDFMICARDAISFLLNEFAIRVTGFGLIKESGLGFERKVKIDFDPTFGANMNEVSFRFKLKDDNGTFVVADPPGGFEFELHDLSKSI